MWHSWNNKTVVAENRSVVTVDLRGVGDEIRVWSEGEAWEFRGEMEPFRILIAMVVHKFIHVLKSIEVYAKTVKFTIWLKNETLNKIILNNAHLAQSLTHSRF